MTVRYRARSAGEKAEKSQAILAAARGLIEERDYGEITMADIAKEARTAKGTLFLYFKTKEELFLALTTAYFKDFFADLETAIRGSPAAEGLSASGREPMATGIQERAGAILSSITRHIGNDPGFLKMIVLLDPVIERNSSYEKILEMKRFMLERMESLGANLERVLPGMATGSGRTFLMRLYGVAVGYLNLANPASCARHVIENEELSAFRFDFRGEFEETAAILLAGTLKGGLDGSGK